MGLSCGSWRPSTSVPPSTISSAFLTCGEMDLGKNLRTRAAIVVNIEHSWGETGGETCLFCSVLLHPTLFPAAENVIEKAHRRIGVIHGHGSRHGPGGFQLGFGALADHDDAILHV